MLGTARLPAVGVAALQRVTGDRDVAFSAAFQHAVLAAARAVAPSAVLQAERDVILDRFRGGRAAYLAALARAKIAPGLARTILGDELRRRAVEATLRVTAPAANELQDWYANHDSVKARAVRIGARTTLVLAPADRIFALGPGATATIDGVKVTALGEVAPLGSFAFALAAPAVKAALAGELKDAAFATWLRRRENQSLPRLACAHDELPQPAGVDLTDWAPFLALR